MKGMAGGIHYLKQRVRDAYGLSDLSVLAVGVIGTIGHPVYWLWWTYIDPQPNESTLMRVIGTLACLLLLLRRFWPAALMPFLPWYYFLTVAYTLPFFFTYYLITGHYSMIWSMAEVGMMFFLIAIFPSFVALVLNLAIGVGFAILCAWLVEPQSLQVDGRLLLYTYLPVFAFGISAGLTFSYSNMRGITAQAKNGALRALAGTIAHEMRNPLSQLRHVLDRVEEALPAMADSRPSPALPVDAVASLSQHLAHGQLAIDRGLRIIAMTLDEVSARPMQSDNLSYASAAETTRKALDEYGFSGRQERSRVNLMVLEDFTFKVDETVYLFTLFNLVKNALHHMAAHPRATLTLTVDQGKVIVHDTGPGIAAEMMPHLFEPFRTQGNSAGTGLGLAYCQRAMCSFGGTIECRSEPGRFTQFTLKFPAIPESEIAAYRQQLLTRATEFFNGKAVLLVDDDVVVREKVCHALSGVGARVVEAENGERALTLLRQDCAYDLVLMDINMPGLDGYTTTEKIRSDANLASRSLLVVGYTAEAHNLARVLAKGAGMDATISKSIRMVELVSRLQKLMESGDRHSRHPRFDGFAGRTILVADDDTYSRMVAKSYLERCGASVVEAENGQDVIARLQGGGSVDAIVMDMKMPGMGGVETAAWIRARVDEYGEVPIVALTGQSDMAAVRACLAAGMNEVMTKPVQVGVLYACLARQFARSRVASEPENRQRPAVAVMRAAGRVADQAVIAEDDVLDEGHLEELASLDMLNHTFLKGVAQIRSLLVQLATSVENGDIRAVHAVLHLLLGVSGNIGAKALHLYVKQIYPNVLHGQWPVEIDWFDRTCALGNRSADALHQYYVTARNPVHQPGISNDD